MRKRKSERERVQESAQERARGREKKRESKSERKSELANCRFMTENPNEIFLSIKKKILYNDANSNIYAE